MLNSNASYPYPMLRENVGDYNTSVFDSQMDVIREADGFRITPKFQVNNQEICDLIDSGKLSYAIQLQCRSTWLRDIILVKDNQPAMLPASMVHERVDLCPCIIATTTISPFVNSDFNEVFSGINISLNKNDVIGIGIPIKFQAIYESDTVKQPNSIITVDSIEGLNSMKVILDRPDNIHVQLPPNLHKMYMKAGTGSSEQVLLINAIVHIPAIVYALTIVHDDDENDTESDYSESSWYKSLVAAINKLADEDPDKVSELLNDPVYTAELLVENNILNTLDIISDDRW